VKTAESKAAAGGRIGAALGRRKRAGLLELLRLCFARVGWYAWAWLGTACPRHDLLIRRHLTTGELAFHCCLVPAGQPVPLTRLVRAAGCRWPAGEDFRSGKGWPGPGESQVRLFTAIARHTALVMAALAICAVAAALLRRRTGTRAPAPVRPGPAPARRPGADPAHRPRDRQAARPSAPARRQPALAGLAPPPPGPAGLAPPAHPARPRRTRSLGQLATGQDGSGHQSVTCGGRPRAMPV
jgi:hypothetical protein